MLGFHFPLSVGMSGSLHTQLVFKGHTGGGLFQGQVVDKEAALQSAPDSAEVADARSSVSSWVRGREMGAVLVYPFPVTILTPNRPGLGFQEG